MPAILATKIRRPDIPPKRIQRPHLVQRLTAGLHSGRQLTLVSAPAGSGKTTCISEWIETLDIPAAWLSLDPSDDDPARFFPYLTAALQKLDPELGNEIQAILRAGKLPPDDVISTSLINEMLAFDSRLILVLDDFHVIQDETILKVFEKLVANFPPALHLVLLTREDPPLPLARLRAHNQLSEIRADDLRFSPTDTGRFLNEILGLNLSQADIRTLEERTEGWIVGLQLAGLSVRDRADPSSFIARLGGTHRYILSYLTEEVLNQQSAAVQQFLLETSILDRLSGTLCDAVTGRADSREMLESLFNANLFLVSLDDERQWYRYHHLFADLLRDRLHSLYKGRAAELHRRASAWYDQANLPDEAIQHALAGEDYAAATQLIDKYATGLLIQWHVKTVKGWIQALPPEWGLHNPKTNLAFAWLHLMQKDAVQAAPYIERLQRFFSERGLDQVEQSLAAEWLALQAMLLNAQGKPAESIAVGEQAMQMAEPGSAVRSQVAMSLGMAYEQLGEDTQALETYLKVLQESRSQGNLTSELLGASGLGRLMLLQGKNHAAFEIASQAVARSERAGLVFPILIALYGELGQVHYQWHQLEQAIQANQNAIRVGTLSGFSDALIYHGLILSRIALMKGDLDTSALELQKIIDLMQVAAPIQVREEIVAQQVRVSLAQNQPRAAEQALIRAGFCAKNQFSIPELASDQVISYPFGVLITSALRILVYRARTFSDQDAYHQGIDLAGRLLSAVFRRKYLPIALDTYLLRAQLDAAVGNEQASLDDVATALELGEPEGFISIFVEAGPETAAALEKLLVHAELIHIDLATLRKILAAFPGPQAGEDGEPAAFRSIGQDLVEPLTERESGVMRLMAEGLKYEEIAARLVISLNTVRTHVKAIYGKLGVNNRTTAIETARELNIL